MKFHKRQFKLKRHSYKYIFLLLFSASENTFAIGNSNFLNYQDRVQSCSFPQYPLLIDEDKSDVLNAGTMEIKSNGEMYLNGNVFIGLNEGRINAESATFLQKQNSVKNIKNGSIYHSKNYFNFLNGSFEKKSGQLKLDNGTTFLSERNLLISYESLDGNLGEYLKFKNATLTSCNNDSQGWEIEAENINIDENKSRGYIKNMKLKILNKKIFTLPNLPFPATNKRLSGFLEPELNFTSDGLDLFLPYFWVLSDKSDITIAPRIINDRGSGIEGNYRYLTNIEHENYIDLLFFPKDKEFKRDISRSKDQRWAFRFKENRQLSHFTTYIDWAKSSDPMVLLDLPSSITNIANQRDHYLNQTFSMNFLSNNLSFNLRRDGYQSLNPFINNGYIKEPEVSLKYSKYGSKISYFAKANYTNFVINKNGFLLFDSKSIDNEGKRFVAEVGTEIKHSLKYADILINGKILHKKYNLNRTNFNNNSSSIPSFNIKISSLLKRFSGSDLSLISPEIIYEKTGFKDQSMDPYLDLHQRNFQNPNSMELGYFFGKDRVPDTEFLVGKLKWQKRLENQRFKIQVTKKNEIKTSRVINSMLIKPIEKDNQIGANLSFENKILKTFIESNYSQKQNTINFGRTGLKINLPETKLSLSRNFHRNIPLLNLNNELDYAEFSIEHYAYGGYKLMGGISKDLDSKKNLETYFGIGFENCCLAFKIYASDKRLSKYNLIDHRNIQFENTHWEKMISVENKSRINFEFELKGLTGRNKKINNFFSNTFLNL